MYHEQNKAGLLGIGVGQERVFLVLADAVERLTTKFISSENMKIGISFC